MNNDFKIIIFRNPLQSSHTYNWNIKDGIFGQRFSKLLRIHGLDWAS